MQSFSGKDWHEPQLSETLPSEDQCGSTIQKSLKFGALKNRHSWEKTQECYPPGRQAVQSQTGWSWVFNRTLEHRMCDYFLICEVLLRSGGLSSPLQRQESGAKPLSPLTHQCWPNSVRVTKSTKWRPEFVTPSPTLTHTLCRCISTRASPPENQKSRPNLQNININPSPIPTLLTIESCKVSAALGKKTNKTTTFLCWEGGQREIQKSNFLFYYFF